MPTFFTCLYSNKKISYIDETGTQESKFPMRAEATEPKIRLVTRCEENIRFSLSLVLFFFAWVFGISASGGGWDKHKIRSSIAPFTILVAVNILLWVRAYAVLKSPRKIIQDMTGNKKVSIRFNNFSGDMLPISDKNNEGETLLVDKIQTVGNLLKIIVKYDVGPEKSFVSLALGGSMTFDLKGVYCEYSFKKESTQIIALLDDNSITVTGNTDRRDAINNGECTPLLSP